MNKRQQKSPPKPRTKAGYAKPLAKVKARKGELVMRYGRDEDGETDTCFAWGDGCSKADGALAHSAMTEKRCVPDLLTPRLRLNVFDLFKYEPSFFEELERRGYDLKTATFSIMKKTP
jgi:hypothetical protein